MRSSKFPGWRKESVYRNSRGGVPVLRWLLANAGSLNCRAILFRAYGALMFVLGVRMQMRV